jgi:hypothetical protein
MKSLPLSLAVGALALGLASSAQAAMIVPLPGTSTIVEKAGCYDECEYYLEAMQEAREEAREAAHEAAEYAAEEAEEYGYRPRRASRRQRMAKPAQVEKPSALKNVAKASDEAAPAKASGAKKDVAVNTGTCKQYSPATGMLLSVACE